MKYLATKIYRTWNNHISYGLSSSVLPTGYCSGFHGSSELPVVQWDKLIENKELTYEMRGCSYPELHMSVEVSSEEIAAAGVMFVVTKAEKQTKMVFAAIDHWDGKNHYHDTVDVFEMERRIQQGLCFSTEAAYQAYKASLTVSI